MEKENDWSGLIDLFQLAHTNPEILKTLLSDLFTPKELEELATRWKIIKLLNKHVPQQKIAQDLGVGVATVTRGAALLKNPHGGFNQALNLYERTRTKK